MKAPAYFGRVYKLEVGSSGEILTLDSSTTDTTNPAQIVFSVDQTPNSNISYATITIYGLMKKHREAVYKEYDKVRLTAGYQETFGVIFEGGISNVSIERDGVDVVVRLYCRSAASTWETAYVNQSFGANTPQLDIIKAVAASFGLPVEINGDFSRLTPAIKGLTISSGSRAKLTELSRSFGFSWIVLNDKVVVTKSGATRNSVVNYEYSATSGMIGSPRITRPGADIDVLLNPKILPGDLFTITAETGVFTFNSVFYENFPSTIGVGTYRALALSHRGDFYGDSWVTSIEGVNPNGPFNG